MARFEFSEQNYVTYHYKNDNQTVGAPDFVEEQWRKFKILTVS